MQVHRGPIIRAGRPITYWFFTYDLIHYHSVIYICPTCCGFRGFAPRTRETQGKMQPRQNARNERSLGIVSFLHQCLSLVNHSYISNLSWLQFVSFKIRLLYRMSSHSSRDAFINIFLFQQSLSWHNVDEKKIKALKFAVSLSVRERKRKRQHGKLSIYSRQNSTSADISSGIRLHVDNSGKSRQDLQTSGRALLFQDEAP